MKKIIQLLVMLCCISLFCRCEDPDMDEEFAAYEDYPVASYLATLPEYSEWVKMLKRSKYFDGINVGVSFTCFVANNEAVGRYLEKNNYKTVDEISEDQLRILMGYHIVAGVKYTAIMFNGTLSSETLSGDYLTVKPKKGGMQEIYVNEKSKIVKKDDECLNGVIHHLSDVLEPVVVPIWTKLQDPRYSIFYSACQEVGLEDYLSTRDREVGEMDEDGILKSMREYKTILVVSDSIFKENGIHSFDVLKEQYPSNEDATDVRSLENFVKYHVINGFMDFASLGTFGDYMTDKRKVIGTLAFEQIMTVTDDRGFLVFNKSGANLKLIPGKIDIQASNGFIHEIGGLLAPEEAEQGVVTWELTDYDCFRILPFYRKWSSDVDMTVHVVDRKHAEECGVIWQTIPDNDDALKYYLRAYQEFARDDAASAFLGNVGWMEFTTPVIPKGKYKIRMHRQSYSARGVINMFIDGAFFREISYRTGPRQIDLGNWDFSNQASHKIKLVIKQYGQVDTDQLIFIPIK